MTRQRQSCEDMGAKCPRQNERQIQGLEAGVTLVCSRKRRKLVWMKHQEGERDGTRKDWRPSGPNLVGCDKEQGDSSGFSEALPKALSQGVP